MMFNRLLAASALALITAAGASAQSYVSGSAGFSLLKDSDNVGALTREFTTGDGVAVPAGTVLASGTEIGWSTEFDNGLFLAGAYGYRFSEKLRGEFEISYVSNDVDGHADVTAGGGALGGADAAALITGSAPLGVTIADLVADGQGDVTTTAYALNLYYDFDFDDAPLDFYAGAGVGLADVSVDFSPSGVVIIDDSETVSLFQLMFGASFPLSDKTEAFGGYRYRMTGDVGTDSSLFPTSLDIENNSHVLEAGIRFHF